jgi:molecular chaperone DnaK
VMTVMIGRNTTIPTQKKEVFSTATDNQPSVEVHVLQGERTEARYNRTLRKFHLDGILPAPRGVPKVEVTFDIDANGILSVHAKDTVTGKDQKITITANSGLSESDIEKMVKDAAEHEAEDKIRREQIERRNKLDNLCYTIEKTVTEHKDKLPADDVTKLEALVKEGREAVEKQDDEKTQELLTKLEAEMQRVASVMYQAQGANGGGPGAPPGGDTNGDANHEHDGAAAAGGKKDGGVIDAEFEETQQ